MIFTRAREESSGRPPSFNLEPLESRVLLTTVFGFDDNFIVPMVRTFEYLDARDNIIRITVGPGVVAEAIFARGGPFLGPPPILMDIVVPIFDADGNLENDGLGADLFHVYVAASDENGWISVAEVDHDEPGRPLIPHDGDVTLRINPNFAVDDDEPSVTLGPGRALLGARTSAMEDVDEPDEDWPLYQAGIPGGWGVRPAGLDDFPEDPDFNLAAGLRVAAGVNLGRFLFGGVVIGKVNLGASMEIFYAGTVATGNARGTPFAGLGPVEHRDNFRVWGDLRSLVAAGQIGNDGTFFDDTDITPFYTTGFDMSVVGRLGQVTTLGTLVGSVRVDGNPLVPTLPTAYMEVEASDSLRSFSTGHIGGRPLSTLLNNDDFFSAQYLGTFNSHTLGHNVVHVEGSLNLIPVPPDEVTTFREDYIDFYAVGLMAGQNVEVQLVLPAGFPQGTLTIGVFDPDGRLIATDHSAVDPAVTRNQPFRFTADRPGAYRFAVAHPSDPLYIGEPTSLIGFVPYALIVHDAGTITAGGIVAGDRYHHRSVVQPGIEVFHGDFGELFAGNIALSQSGAVASLGIWGGNLRSIDAGRVGWREVVDGTDTFELATGLDLMVPGGAVGLVRSRDLGLGLLSLNPNFLGMDPAQVAIGGSYQVIEAAPDPVGGAMFFGVINTNQGLGVLRAGHMSWVGDTTARGLIPFPSVINLNVDRRGFDGVLDLIDVSGDVGVGVGGGPQITTGPGGNVRYMRVGGTLLPDAMFGIGFPIEYHPPGESVFIRDDSGTQMILTPVGGVPNPDFNPDEPEDPIENPRFIGLASLRTVTYGIRGSGGVVLVEVMSTGSLDVQAHAFGVRATAEISRIELRHLGREVILPPDPDDENGNGNGNGTGIGIGNNQPPTPFHPDRNMQIPQVQRPVAGRPVIPLQLAQGENLEVTLRGRAIVDVLHIVAVDPEPPDFVTFTSPTRIINQTMGEIVSIYAASIGELVSAGTIGLAKNHTGAAMNPIHTMLLGDGYATPRGSEERRQNPSPTVSENDPGNLGFLFPWGGDRAEVIGVFDLQKFGIVVSGDIISVRANHGLGNIVAAGTIGEVIANADRRRIPGIFSGIAAPVWSVISPGVENDSSIQGRILFVDIGEGIAPGGTGNNRQSGLFSDNVIGTVVNQGLGSNVWGPINAGSHQASGRLDLVHLNNGAFINSKVMSVTDHNMTRELPIVRTINIVRPIPQDDIGEIRVTGPRGGMVGTLVAAHAIGPMNVMGFGIAGSNVISIASGRVGLMTVGGYGVRTTTIVGGLHFDGIVTLGAGQNIPATRFTPDVRRSEGGVFDPRFGFRVTRLSDIHGVLGTSSAAPVIPNVTDAGALDLVDARGGGNLGLVHVHNIRSSAFNFANTTDIFNSRARIVGLQLTTGQMNHFRSVSEVLLTNVTVAGPLSQVTMLANFGDSSIEAIGPSGSIGTMRVGRNFDGRILSVTAIQNVIVGGAFNGHVEVQGAVATPIKLHHFQVRGPYAGTFDVIGSVGNFIVGGPLLQPPDVPNLPMPERRLVIQGNVNLMRVGGNLASDVRVLGSAGRIVIGGSILSDVELQVDDTLGALVVRGNIEETAVIRARQLNALFVGGVNQGFFDIWGF